MFQREKEEADHTSEEAKSSLPKGSVIYFSGVPNTCTRENIKACMDKYDADIAYIDFQRGLTEGWVRLQGENAAKLLLEKTDGGKVRKILHIVVVVAAAAIVTLVVIAVVIVNK